MDQSVKIALASGVLLGGVVLAVMFRRESPHSGPSIPETGDRLVLRRHPPPLPGEATHADRDGRSKSSAGTSGGSSTAGAPTVISPVDSAAPPPVLAKEYPSRGVPATSRWGTSIGVNLPQAARPKEAPQTHKIVDGDSLKSLAERYLGSPDRYLEIFQANRHVLSSPQVLPIGAELKIPSGSSDPNSSSSADPAADSHPRLDSNPPVERPPVERPPVERPLGPISRQ